MLYEHSKKYHNNQKFEVDISILARCFGELTTRMITEAVLINELSDNDTLNSRSEWNYVKLPNYAITRN